MTDLRDRMRDLEHERERLPPDECRSVCAPVSKSSATNTRRSYGPTRTAGAWRTYGRRRPWATGRAWPRCATCADPTRSMSTTPARLWLEEGWGRGFWNELTGFREEHPNWGGWAMPVLRNDQFNYNGEFEPYFKEPEDIRYRDDAVCSAPWSRPPPTNAWTGTSSAP